DPAFVLLFQEPTHQVAVRHSFAVKLDIQPALLQSVNLFSSQIESAADCTACPRSRLRNSEIEDGITANARYLSHAEMSHGCGRRQFVKSSADGKFLAGQRCR